MCLRVLDNLMVFFPCLGSNRSSKQLLAFFVHLFFLPHNLEMLQKVQISYNFAIISTNLTY